MNYHTFQQLFELSVSLYTKTKQTLVYPDVPAGTKDDIIANLATVVYLLAALSIPNKRNATNKINSILTERGLSELTIE